jgi:hypothetical protein
MTNAALLVGLPAGQGESLEDILIPSFSRIFSSNKVDNLLKFVGMADNIWLECIDTEPGEFPCILALRDSTSAISWLHSASTLNDST